MNSANDSASQVRFLFATGRIRDALVVLNVLSTCRFTALFRFDKAGLQNLVLIDRDSRVAPRMDTIPVCDSYCAFVQASRQAFIVNDSMDDARLEGHPKQRVVRSYVGVPLKGADGEVFGTLCHFDFDVAAVPRDALALTRQVATFLDPAVAIDAMVAGIDHGIAALRDMLDLILAASTDLDSAANTFDEYANPIRDEAMRKLPSSQFEAVEATVAGLREALLSMGPGTAR